MLDSSRTAIRATTQDHLDVEDIQDDLVILKDGSVCLVLQTAAVNFGLLSETEQDATIYAYAGLLNSLTFPLQILIKSQRKDISAYLKLLKKEEDQQKNNELRDRIKDYRLFIESMVRENNVLDKKFYLVLPFFAVEMGLKSGSGLFKKGLPYPKSYILERAKTALFPKRDHLVRQFNRIGLKISQLTTKQLIELFFKTYNPESVGSQQIANPEDYSKPLVEAAIDPASFTSASPGILGPTTPPPLFASKPSIPPKPAGQSPLGGAQAPQIPAGQNPQTDTPTQTLWKDDLQNNETIKQ